MVFIWASVTGGVFSGKTNALMNIVDRIRSESQINLCGFIQPSYYYNDEREGYNLLILSKNDILIEKFAMVNYAAKPGIIPYNFNNEGFINTEKEANSYEFDGKPVLCIIDEFGQLEAIFNKGHYNAVCKWIERLKEYDNAIIVLSYHERRKAISDEFMMKFGVKKADFQLNLPASDEDINEFYSCINNTLIH